MLSLHLLAEFGDAHSPLLTGCAIANVHRAVLEALLAGRDPDRDADQVGVCELLTGTLVAVVEQYLTSRVRQRLRRPIADLVGPREHDDVHIVWSDRGRPDDAELVVSLLDDRRHHAGRADAVAAHDQRPLLPVLVEEVRVERLREPRLELEDVPHLDRRLETESAAAVRTGVPLD